ncbi:MAG TPA: glucosamine-6-phosphate deaminase [Polyangia bacterium]|nr:glucosamine-6-phosphate deaminase [Polyangia bacterium]
MNVVVLPTPEGACLRAAEIVAEVLAAKPDAVLALPAGNTPRPVYAELARRHREEGLSFVRALAFALDEYAGIGPEHRASFARFLDDELYRHIDLPRAHAHAPHATATDLDGACLRYERGIEAAGGLDLCLLGIGGNGHIAFNEPGSPFDSRTRVVELAEESRAGATGAFGADPVPAFALTIGIATILSARRCVLLATGAAKAGVVAAAIESAPAPALPASALQLHPGATVILDAAAASRITRG